MTAVSVASGTSVNVTLSANDIIKVDAPPTGRVSIECVSGLGCRSGEKLSVHGGQKTFGAFGSAGVVKVTSLSGGGASYEVNPPQGGSSVVQDPLTGALYGGGGREISSLVSGAGFSSLRYDASGKSGSPLAALDSGQAVSVFGNSPPFVLDGLIQHAPSVGSNAAAYMQSQVANGRVKFFGADFIFPTGSGATVALVLPTAAWATGSLTPALHCTIKANGIYEFGAWNGSSVDRFADGYGGTGSSLADGTVKSLLGWIDFVDQTLTMRMPDGKVVVCPVDGIGTLVQSNVVWELFATAGTSEPAPAQIVRMYASGENDIGSQLLEAQIADVRGKAGRRKIAKAFTPAQVNALNATPQLLVPSMGANNIVVPRSIQFFKYAGTAYTVPGAADIEIRYTNASGALVSKTLETTGFLDQATEQIRTLSVADSFSNVKNAGLYLCMPGGTTSGGSNNLIVSVWYDVFQANLGSGANSPF